MANQTSHMRPQSITPDSLTAAERAVLFNIETHAEWSDSRGVTALFEKGLVTRSNGRFTLTDQGRAALDGLLRTTSGAAECTSPGTYNPLAPSGLGGRSWRPVLEKGPRQQTRAGITMIT